VNVPSVGEVWEEWDTTGWLVISEPRTDPEDGTEFVLMTLLYYCNGSRGQYLGIVEGIPIYYLKSGWVKVS